MAGVRSDSKRLKVNYSLYDPDQSFYGQLFSNDKLHQPFLLQVSDLRAKHYCIQLFILFSQYLHRASKRTEGKPRGQGLCDRTAVLLVSAHNKPIRLRKRWEERIFIYESRCSGTNWKKNTWCLWFFTSNRLIHYTVIKKRFNIIMLKATVSMLMYWNQWWNKYCAIF